MVHIRMTRPIHDHTIDLSKVVRVTISWSPSPTHCCRLLCITFLLCPFHGSKTRSHGNNTDLQPLSRTCQLALNCSPKAYPLNPSAIPRTLHGCLR